MRRKPRPDDFTVDIREKDGTWFVQVNEAPEIRGEGKTLAEAVRAASDLAIRPFSQLAASGVEAMMRAFAMSTAIDEWGEDFADGVESERALREDDFVPFEEFEKELDA